ncbi:XK-related protein 6 [Octopus vulgaris]|uniref:XK-related protein n=1 Tax=Octopus vulgaris TaxID=6645 RepID=A0AA36C0H4_OCTVU|nr:XK-related protein 6 [Octopus vulgaris]
MTSMAPPYLPTVQKPEREAPRFRVPIETKNFDEPDGVPKGLPYTRIDVTITVLTIIFFFVDVATDLGLAFSYLNRTRYLWFGLTLAFVLVPSVSNSILNLYFYYQDYKVEQKLKSKDPNFESSSSLWIFRFVFTILQMGPIVRNFESLRYGMKSQTARIPAEREYYYRWMLREDTDACMLRLFECFMESAPQLTLQLYILVVDPADASNPLRIISLLSSWIGICWSLASYYKSLRFSRENKENLTVSTQTNEREKNVPPNMITYEKQERKQKLEQELGYAPHKRSNISMVTVTPPISERSLAMARSGHSLDGDILEY